MREPVLKDLYVHRAVYISYRITIATMNPVKKKRGLKFQLSSQIEDFCVFYYELV